jgi:hypothetical protein
MILKQIKEISGAYHLRKRNLNEQLGSKLPSFKRVLTERYVSQSHPFA